MSKGKIPVAALWIVVVFNLGNHAFARDVSVVTLDWAPHVGVGLRDGGPLAVITREAFRRGGHNAKVTILPWNRALKNVEEGKDDAAIAAYYNEERSKIYLFTEEVYKVDLGLVSMESLGISHYKSLRDLTSYKIGVSMGYINGEEFDNAEYLNKAVARSPKLNLRKLFRNRIDMMVGEFDVLRFESDLEGLNRSKLVFIQPPLESHSLYTIVSGVIKDGEQLVEDFNRGLALMKADGSIDKILKEHLNRE